jgi:hypothetical protein
LLDLDLGKISKTATKDPKSAPSIKAFEFANGPLNDELMMTARLGERVPRIDIAANSRALSRALTKGKISCIRANGNAKLIIEIFIVEFPKKSSNRDKEK